MKLIENMGRAKTVFSEVPLVGQSLLRRIFKQLPPENAVIELNNLLALKGVDGVDGQQLQDLELKYGIVFSTYQLNLEEYYAVYWNAYTKAGADDPTMEAETVYLARVLKLNEETMRILRNKVGEASFREEAISRLKKRRMTSADKAYLQDFGSKLQLEDAVSAQIIVDEKVKVLEGFLEAIKKKSRCTPDEWQEAEAILTSFEWPQTKSKNVREQLTPLKYYWELENLTLKPVSHSGNLQKSESCYLEVRQVKWMETRSAGRGYQQLEQVNYGTLYLTNKRLVFEGNAKNSVIPYDRIRSISNQQNGITIHKDKGKDPVLSVSGDRLVVEIVLKRLLSGGV